MVQWAVRALTSHQRGYNPKANTTCWVACLAGCFLCVFCVCVSHKVRDTAAWNAPIDFSFDLGSAFMPLYPLLHKTQTKNTPKNLPIQLVLLFWCSHCHGPHGILTSLRGKSAQTDVIWMTVVSTHFLHSYKPGQSLFPLRVRWWHHSEFDFQHLLLFFVLQYQATHRRTIYS